jgi:pyruvate/2-oxoglutarate dehydrogenase complex dihydrolipoamide dehydrogenase (E3) component
MDNEIAKQTQKILQKQGLKFKLNTKVTAGEVHDAGVNVSVEAAKGGKEETVSSAQGFGLGQIANSHRLTLTSFLLPSVAAHTPLVSVWTTSTSRLTTEVA